MKDDEYTDYKLNIDDRLVDYFEFIFEGTGRPNNLFYRLIRILLFIPSILLAVILGIFFIIFYQIYIFLRWVVTGKGEDE